MFFFIFANLHRKPSNHIPQRHPPRQRALFNQALIFVSLGD